MKALELSRRAQIDLDGIRDYSTKAWGKTQTKSYLRQIQAVIRSIRVNSNLGRSADDLRESCRRTKAGTHIVFFRVIGDRVIIIRILHEQMDFAAHLA